jgi:hypothetical protein
MGPPLTLVEVVTPNSMIYSGVLEHEARLTAGSQSENDGTRQLRLEGAVQNNGTG